MSAVPYLVRAATLPTAPAGEAGGPRLLDAPVVFDLHSREHPHGAARHDLGDHVSAFGPRPSATGHHGEELLQILQDLALTGRGGGHFPVATKWRAALGAGGGGTVVANGAEGEPASAKDATLLQLRPHLVLDGLELAAEAIGADDAVVWLHEGDAATHRAVALALAERRAAGAIGTPVRIVTGPDRYLSGEASAVVRALSGGPALPYLERRPAAVEGIGGLPTIVHNAETLARVALAARTGSDDGDSEAGPGRSVTGGTLLTVVVADRRVVLEADSSRTLGEIITDVLAPAERAHSPAAVLVGGFGGSWVPWSTLAPLPPTEPALRRAGASLGAGLLLPLSRGGCGLAETAAMLRYLAASSARQCGPCLFGLPAMDELVTAIAEGSAKRSDVRQLERFTAQIERRGACHHPDGAIRLVRSAFAVFADDLRRHLADGPCPGALRTPTFPVPEVH